MAYSNSRLRFTLAVVRIGTGVLFLSSATHKIFSWEFAQIEFPQWLRQATHGASVGSYSDFLTSVVSPHVSGTAALLGFTEMFIGVGLVLGLAVRPVSLVGMLYSLNLMLATWNAPGADEPVWRYLDNAGKLILMFFILLLLGVGHAGESWGLGSLYHRHRDRQWAEEVSQQDDDAFAKVPTYHRPY